MRPSDHQNASPLKRDSAGTGLGHPTVPIRPSSLLVSLLNWKFTVEGYALRSAAARVAVKISIPRIIGIYKLRQFGWYYVKFVRYENSKLESFLALKELPAELGHIVPKQISWWTAASALIGKPRNAILFSVTLHNLLIQTALFALFVLFRMGIVSFLNRSSLQALGSCGSDCVRHAIIVELNGLYIIASTLLIALAAPLTGYFSIRAAREVFLRNAILTECFATAGIGLTLLAHFLISVHSKWNSIIAVHNAAMHGIRTLW